MMGLPARERRRQLAARQRDWRLDGQYSPRNRRSCGFPSAWFPAGGTPIRASELEDQLGALRLILTAAARISTLATTVIGTLAG